MLLMDAHYDDNHAIGLCYTRGYLPVVRPNRKRLRGFWRRKSRTILELLPDNYRYRFRENRSSGH